MSAEGKVEGAKESKTKVKSPEKICEVFKNLLEHSNVPESVKNSVKDIDLEREFDYSKVAKSIVNQLKPIFGSEVEKYNRSRDAFDCLISGEQAQGEVPVEHSSLTFCLDAIKAIAFEIPDKCELLQLKFKNPLIRCVLCNNVPDALRNEASVICEKIMEKTKYVEDEIDSDGSEKWLSVYFWVVKRALLEGANRSEVKRVWTMHKLLTRYIVTDSSPVFETLKSMIVSPNFLHHKEGRQLIARLLSFNKSLVVKFHLKIKDALPSLAERSKPLACSYGEIFNMAWTNALPEVRELLEEEVIQRWMEIYLKLNRPKPLSQGIMGKTIFRILSYLHNSRRLLQLSSAITRLYEPILWRSLKSYHPLERCNAAELFLDVFPLEKPESNIIENSNFMEKQFRQIMDLLKDESHYTRIVAIRGVILVFKRRIQCLSNAYCREIISWLANDLANDGSSYLVRVAVWEFFASLAASDDPPEFLTSLLPQMTNHFHDISEQVRKAFTTMLLNISTNTHIGISVTDVTPRPHIIARLALEGESVGKLLTNLVMKSIYTEGLGIMDFIKNLKRLILQCPKAAENLFRWSVNILTVQNAHFIIMAVLVYLRQFTKDRVENRSDGSGKSTCHLSKVGKDSAGMETESEGENPPMEPENSGDIENVSSMANQQLPESPSASPVRKKRKKNKKSSPPQPNKINEEEKFDIDGPTAEIHAHMLGCVHTLWLVFSKQFESHPNMVSELNTVLTVCLQNYLRCYKGTPAWYASLALASLVPLTKLSENTTASSSCLAELRRTEIDTPAAHTECLVYTLTAWNRGYEIIELAIDYIDPAFKLFQLDSTIFFSAREGKSSRRVVKFMKPGGREAVGLKLLSLLLHDYHNVTRLLLKNYDHVHDLFFYLEGIKVIIETRLGEGLNKDSSEVLTDPFILECFKLFLDLVPLLNRPEPPADSDSSPFVSTHHMSTVIEWATRCLIPLVKKQEILTEESEESSSEEEDDEIQEEEEEDSRKNKKKKVKKTNKKEEVNVDLHVSCLKAIIQSTVYMININLTDITHTVVSANFALSLIKSEGNYWFLEDCLNLVEAISEYTRAWKPDDEDKILSVICLSLYSHILLSLTSNVHLTPHLLRRYKCDLGPIKRKLLYFPNILLSMYKTCDVKFTKVFNKIIELCIDAIHAEAVRIDNIETMDKVEELPLGLSMVTNGILSRPKLVPPIFPAILEFVENNKNQGVLVVCSVSYVYTLLESNCKKFDRAEMVSVVQKLYKIVQELPVSNAAQSAEGSSAEDSFFLEPLAKLDARKVGLSVLEKIADSVNCQLVCPPSSAPTRH